jgi:protein-S-isoprenylcysteine O-methyltransferase Ste14
MNPKTDHAAVVVNPFVIYLGLALLAILLHQVLPLFSIPKQLAHSLGLILIVFNFGFGLLALRGMVQVKTSPNPHRASTSLVVSGIYQFTRNPMYVGLTLVFAGLLLYFQVLWGLVLVPLVVWLITFCVIMPEETYLEKKFGEEYVQYKATVRRWL